MIANNLSVVIPTYQREHVLLDTIAYLLELRPAPAEILIVDQTAEHGSETDQALARLDEERKIRWIRLPRPSITHAMNTGLTLARGEIVLFLDDDIIPHENLFAAHVDAHSSEYGIIAGQVFQPGEELLSEAEEARGFKFSSGRKQFVREFIGCNFSVKRSLALEIGGFDENFVHVAYRYEADFARRMLTAGREILFDPAASIRHLKESRGGTRSFGHHLTTVKPSHAVGAYYYLLRARGLPHRFRHIVARPFKAVRTRHHLTHPWWIPPTFAAEVTGLAWAAFLWWRGPRLVEHRRGEGAEA